MNHLAIYKRFKNNNYIEWMLNGTETLDIKFSYRKTAPYKRLNPNDFIYIKESGGPVVGRCTIDTVEDIEIEDSEQILNILLSVWEPIGLRDEDHARKYYTKISTKKYATIFTFKDPVILNNPIRIDKHDQRVWIPDYKLPEELEYEFKKISKV